MSKVTLELRISTEMSCLHKIQVKKSSSSVKTEKVKDHRKKELNLISPTWLCYTDSKCDRVNQNKRNNQKICEKVKFDKDLN